MMKLCISIVGAGRSDVSPLCSAVAGHGYPFRVYESMTEFLGKINSASSGCAIVDLTHSVLGGMKFLGVTNRQRPDISVVFITDTPNIRLAVRAIKCGASDFLEKRFLIEHLASTLADACKAAHHASVAARMERNARERLARLTPREATVLKALLRGGRTKEVGCDLGISARTVEVYRANITKKLEIRALPEAARIAHLAGFSWP